MAPNTFQTTFGRIVQKIINIIAGIILLFAACGLVATVFESTTPDAIVNSPPYSYQDELHRIPNGSLLDTFEPRLTRIIARSLIPDSPIANANVALMLHDHWSIKKLVDHGMLRPMASGLPEAIDEALGAVKCVKLIVMKQGRSARDGKHVNNHMRWIPKIIERLEKESAIWEEVEDKDGVMQEELDDWIPEILEQWEKENAMWKHVNEKVTIEE
ncbi:hypothetical protein HBI82_128940 [Parastagonospora nodorum]|nr:hypothetical protein HBI20_180900 [Parastagonospora nodorum]KAH6010220.1 hypothetical protein HBI82_128940 [Parastagonospora nodorum]